MNLASSASRSPTRFPGCDHPRRGLTIENVDGGTPRGVHAASVSPDFFADLGAPVVAGRVFHSWRRRRGTAGRARE